ncbi:MAG: hypothetical protein ABFD79_11815 [Phycisphaerales bacterium]|jgi:hypothetical protein
MNFIKKLFSKEQKIMVTQVPSKPFALSKDFPITAEEDLILALPLEILSDKEKLQDVIDCSNDALTSIENNLIYLKLSKGMSVSLKKNAQCVILSNSAEDRRPRLLSVNKQN